MRQPGSRSSPSRKPHPFRQILREDPLNIFLGNVLEQMAFNKIDRREAIAMAYVPQLILNSQVAMDRQRENENDARFAMAFRRAEAAARAQQPPSANANNN